MNKSLLTYRADIDGLRALAVLAVMLFHARLGCPGGYVGVDIFFVISGFLITSLISKEINADKFSLLTFWERRVRRIYPALFVVVISVIALGCFLFLPSDLGLIGQSVLAQAVLISNVFFWRNMNYFSSTNDSLPLLHTWSLAVEEQFYILFPLLLLFLARNRRMSPSWVVLGLCIASFILSIVGIYIKPYATF